MMALPATVLEAEAVVSPLVLERIHPAIQAPAVCLSAI